MMVFEQKREARMRQRRKQVRDECPLLMFLISSTSKMDPVTAAVPSVKLGLSQASATE